MCKAVVETNLESGDNKGIGLNNGFYTLGNSIIAALIFGIFYRQNKTC